MNSSDIKYCSKCILSRVVIKRISLWPAAAVYWSCVGRTRGSSEDWDFGLFDYETDIDYVTACVRVRSCNTATLPAGRFHVKGRSSHCRRSLDFLMKSPTDLWRLTEATRRLNFSVGGRRKQDSRWKQWKRSQVDHEANKSCSWKEYFEFTVTVFLRLDSR